MTDNYKEFKKWLSKKACNSALNLEEEIDFPSAIELLVEFEKEQFEKRKEKEIKTIIALEISDYSSDYPFNIVNKKVDSIYKKLKERDLIK